MGVAAALVSSAMWALTSVLLASQTARLRPLLMSAVRSFTASLILIGLLVATGGLVQWGRMTFITGISMMGSGVLGQAVGDTLYINALGVLGVTRTFPITNSAYPFLTFVLAVALLGEQVTWLVPAGGLLIVAGISWIVLEQQRPADGVAPTTDVARGLVFAVAAALAWSMATVWLRGQQGNLDAIAAASLRIPAASVAVIATIALTAGASQQRPLAHLTRRSLAIVAIAGVLGTGLGSVLFIYAVEHTGAARTAFLTTTAPLFALPMGMFFLSEQLTPRLALGTVVTVAGIWLVLL